MFCMISPFADQVYKRKAEENKLFWRLILENVVTYTELNGMDWDEVLEANAALDLYAAEQRAAMEKAKRKK